ncbi:hypothetical protein BCV71DRAFT_241842 [Rhizopus microsporus]|uniref:RNA-binding domain-containing protein n=1 Tax=Rhizopus microsporus TaxID=58291 RepID=A0A1X0SAD6_RHIZD|nr:hypothetical protein BCV71DRAFT_241842 [Rhizopus microsporus]
MSDSKQEQTSYEEYAQQYQDYYNYYYDSNGSHNNNTSNANYDYHDAQGSDAYNNDNKSDYQTDRTDNRGYRSNYSSRYGSSMHRMEDTIYISNLPQDVTEEKLAEHFGSIGIIKTDKKLRKPKTTITYDDPPSADAAINWFGGKEFMGNVIQVSKAERKMNIDRGRGGFSNRGGGRGRGGDRNNAARDGDWSCEECGANNFSRRDECFSCHKPRKGKRHDDRRGDDRRGDDRRSDYRGNRSHRRDRPY